MTHQKRHPRHYRKHFGSDFSDLRRRVRVRLYKIALVSPELELCSLRCNGIKIIPGVNLLAEGPLQCPWSKLKHRGLLVSH